MIDASVDVLLSASSSAWPEPLTSSHPSSPKQQQQQQQQPYPTTTRRRSRRGPLHNLPAYALMDEDGGGSGFEDEMAPPLETALKALAAESGRNEYMQTQLLLLGASAAAETRMRNDELSLRNK